MSAISTLTRRLTQLAIRPPTITNVNFNSVSTTAVRSLHNQSKQIASMKKSKPASFLSIRWESTKGSGENNNDAISSLASEKWQELNTIQVDVASLDHSSNEPGTSKAKKTRGGKSLRKTRQRELLARKEGITPANDPSRFTDIGAGQFPPLRFSDDETQRLLDEAYTTMPPRTGKRGTRKAKRNKIKFWKLRKTRAIKKAEKVAHHFKTMETRSQITAEVRAVKEGADDVRNEEKEYQMQVLKDYAMLSGLVKENSTTVNEQNN